MYKPEKHIFRRGLAILIGVNLRLNRRLKTASTQAKPTSVGFRPSIFPESAQADFVCVAATSSRRGLS